MQFLGYFIMDGKKVLVLARVKKYSMRLKLRKSGKDGINLTDERDFLREEPTIYKRLLAGEVVEL